MLTSRLYESITSQHFEENTEFFLLPSYSALPTVVDKLANLEKEGKKAVLFCFSPQLYRFLNPLMQVFAWISVIYIDTTELDTISPYRPWKIWYARKLLQVIYFKWFVEIPRGSIVHFYNSHFALPVFYMIWKIRNSAVIYYTQCDPVELYTQDTTLYSWIKLTFLSLIYPIPFHIVSRKNSTTKPFPALTNFFFEKTVKKKYPMLTDVTHLHQTGIYQALRLKSDTRILWLMGLDLDLGWFVAGDYERTMEDCAAIVDSVCPASEQAVKFHPRARLRENVWDGSVNHLPEYIPAEFLFFSQLKVVLAVSSSALIGLSKNVKIIGLHDLLPFKTQIEREIHRANLLSFAPDTYCPATLEDLRSVLIETLGMAGKLG